MPRKPAQNSPPSLRARIWLDSPSGTPILTEAGADLLEQIEAAGSLSEAARRLRFAYRRAWLLLDAMNKGFDAPLVTATTGGKHGGGATLTDYGRTVLAAYRQVQLHIEHAIDEATPTFYAATRRNQ
ncbi:MAG: winged helix-turn-helix domain-containing protein [Phycisphaerae bacterium]